MSPENDLQRCWREKQEGFAAAADMLKSLVEEWAAAAEERERLREALELAAQDLESYSIIDCADADPEVLEACAKRARAALASGPPAAEGK